MPRRRRAVEFNFSYHKLDSIRRVASRAVRYMYLPEFCDDLDVLSAAVKVDGDAYKYASPRLRSMFPVAAMAMAYHCKAREATPLVFRFCPSVLRAAAVCDRNARKEAFLKLQTSKAVANEIEACKMLGPSTITAQRVEHASAQPFVVTDISGDTWSLEPGEWTTAVTASELVNRMATKHGIGGFELMIEAPDGSFEQATAAKLMAGRPEGMLIYTS